MSISCSLVFMFFFLQLLSCFKCLNGLVPGSNFTSYRERSFGVGVRILQVCINPSCVIDCAALTQRS